ncbi:hypothetical protein [Nocardioides sp.]|uniref:hypothetical protein n=1 Tax=Nocardioides sp. TaxID=35761 RepID=UPI001A31D904|nr:hypothetical protein [Nocardioides sp.]MBJ7356184.1 hypothetical protein [Nocardioides sp.]
MWFFECPYGDQGLVRPLTTASGLVVLLCDSGDEVWREPGLVSTTTPVIPEPPDWEVADGVTIVPGTTHWSERNEIPDAWREFHIHPGPD